MIGDSDFGVFFNPKDFATPAVFHLSSGDLTFNAIFKKPGVVAGVAGGGSVDSSKASLLIPSSDVDVSGVSRRDRVTVSGAQWFVLYMEPDGSGLTEVFLGVSDGGKSAKPAIRY